MRREDYYNSPEWNAKKHERHKIDGYQCQGHIYLTYLPACNYPKKYDIKSGYVSRFDMDAHHLHYRTFGFEDPKTDLITLCPLCHADVHFGTPAFEKRMKSVNEMVACLNQGEQMIYGDILCERDMFFKKYLEGIKEACTLDPFVWRDICLFGLDESKLPRKYIVKPQYVNAEWLHHNL